MTTEPITDADWDAHVETDLDLHAHPDRRDAARAVLATDLNRWAAALIARIHAADRRASKSRADLDWDLAHDPDLADPGRARARRAAHRSWSARHEGRKAAVVRRLRDVKALRAEHARTAAAERWWIGTPTGDAVREAVRRCVAVLDDLGLDAEVTIIPRSPIT